MTTLDSKSSESNSDNMNDDPREEFVVCVSGLPWPAKAERVAEFFSDCNIRGGAKNGIHFIYSRKGHPSGECFVELVSQEDMENALAKSNNFVVKRYVEVFKCKAGEMERTRKRMGQPQDRGNKAVVRLRGLPFQVSKEEIAQFFTGLEIVHNGITITLDEDGRTTEDAFVEFASPELASQAVKKKKEFKVCRYIEIFKSSKADIKYVSKPKLQNDYNGNGRRQGGSGRRRRRRPYRRGRGVGGRRGYHNQGQSGRDSVNVSRSNFGSGQFGGSFNAGDNYINFEVAFNIFPTVFGGQGNQTSGFSSPQPQQQQSNFGNQMGEGGGAGSFGNQGSSFSSNSGAFNAFPVVNLIIKIFEGIRCLIGFLSYLKKILTIHLT